MAKRANPRLIKRHRNYTIDEAARTLGVAKATIRNWIDDGLTVLKDQRPFLILGSDLVNYLESKVAKKQTCLPHQCYCFKCRQPKDPAFNEVEYFPSDEAVGNMRALCSDCSTVMNKRISVRQLPAIKQHTRVRIRQD